MDKDIQGNLTQNCGFMENKFLKKGLAHLLQNVLNNIDEESNELVPLESKEVLAQTIELKGELKGIKGLIGIWDNIRKGFNSELKMGGILITMLEGQFKAHQEILIEIKEECKNKIMIFNSVIPKSSKVSEKQEQASHILDEKRNRVAICYNKFVSQVINLLSKGGC